MKKLCIAVMLLISTVGISQITVTKYDTAGLFVEENKYDIETAYTSKERELILNVRELSSGAITTLYYRILEVIQSTNSVAWTCYKCMNGEGNYVNYTFFYDGKNMMAIHYQSGVYSITEGGGLVY